MLKDNSIFSIMDFQDTEKMLFNTRRRQGHELLTADDVDFEMQYHHSKNKLQLNWLSQDGLERFVEKYGSTYKVLWLYSCNYIEDFSPLADLENIEAIRIDDTRKATQFWDFSNNKSLKVLSVHGSKRLVENPMLLRTSKTLEDVRFWNCGIDVKYTLDSLSCFENMKTLKRIDLNYIKLKNHNFSVLDTLTSLEEFNFDAGMLTTEEIAWICAKYPHISGDCLRPYTENELGCMNDIRICGYRKPGLDLPEDKKRLDKYVNEFNLLVEKFKNEKV